MNTIFNITSDELKVLTGLIKNKYPEFSNTEIRRLVEQNAVRIRGEWEGQQADAIISLGGSILLDDVDRIDCEDFKWRLSTLSENKFSFIKIGKRKYIKL